MKKIVQDGDPVLRQTAAEVPINEITSEKIQNIIADMRTALAGEDDGVGLAAPQIGHSLRMFIVSPLAFKSQKKSKMRDNAEEEVGFDDEDKGIPETDLVFINPEIVKLSQEKQSMEEGCLSVRPLYGKVQRSKKSIIRAYDEHGQKFERGGSGLLSQIFQHEMDHLNGILFIDKAKNIHEYVADNDDSDVGE